MDYRHTLRMIRNAISRIDWRMALPVAALALGLTEGLWGTLQLLGVVESGHPRYPVTGSFYNPGPFGCMLGCIFPLALSLYLRPRTAWLKWVAAVYLLICTLLLPGGMSRTGWIAAIAGSVPVLIGIYRKKILSIERKYLTSGIAVAIIAMSVAGYSIYNLKKDSADGRLLMWKVAASTTGQSRLDGVGWDNVAGAYGDAQERYFGEADASEQEKIVAGSPEYVFNEYLQVAIAFGIPCGIVFLLSMLLSVCIYMRNRLYGLAGMTVGIMATCMASYPLQFAVFKWLIGLSVLFSFLLIRNVWTRTLASAACAAAIIAFSNNTQRTDVHEAFTRANSAYQARDYRNAIEQFHALLPKTSDPMPLNIIGKCYQSLEMPDSAELYYQRSIKRVPNRFYPHYLLMLLYAENPRDSIKMRTEAEYLLSTQPKTNSKAIEEMQDKARSLTGMNITTK